MQTSMQGIASKAKQSAKVSSQKNMVKNKKTKRNNPLFRNIKHDKREILIGTTEYKS